MDKLQRLSSSLFSLFKGDPGFDMYDLKRNEAILNTISEAERSIEVIRSHFSLYNAEELNDLHADISELRRDISQLKSNIPVKKGRLEALLSGQDENLSNSIIRHYISGDPWEDLSEDPDELQEKATELLLSLGVRQEVPA